MKLIKCDNCEKVQTAGSADQVTLHGIAGSIGGILLPEPYHEKHFCDPECFWRWIHRNNTARLVNNLGRCANGIVDALNLHFETHDLRLKMQDRIKTIIMKGFSE